MQITLQPIELKGRDIIDEIESCIYAAKPDLKRAQKLLRQFFRLESGLRHGTMADAIFELSKGAVGNT